MLVALLLGVFPAHAATVTFSASGTWTAPAGVTSVTVEAWGGGGAGGGATGNPAMGGGASGGQYAKKAVTVVPGNSYAVVVGAGGTGGTGNGAAGGNSTFAATTVVAKGGAGGTGATNGVAGIGSITGGVGDVVYAGGNGANGLVTGGGCQAGGAGGGGAGSTGAGGNASGGTAGTGTANGGGAGGAGRTNSGTGNAGSVAGGGGAGACAETGTNRTGGRGAAGQVIISYVGAGPVTYYHDTTNGVAIGVDGPTNVRSGTNVTIPPIITALLTTANTCTGNARSANHPTGSYTHSRWYLNTSYPAATNIGANPGGSARLRGNATTDKVTVSLYDYDPVTGAKVLIGSSPVITLTGGGTTTNYTYTISSALYTVPAGDRLMLQYDFNQPAATNNARVYCSSTGSYITVTESPALVAPHHIVVQSDGSGQTCRAETLTVTACANAACTAPYFTAATVTGNVTWTGSPGGTLPFTIASGGTGQTTVSLAVTTAQTVTLGTSAISPSQTNPPSTCVNTGGGAACSMVFTAATACFDVVEVGAAASTSIFTKLSGTAFSLDVLAGSAYTGNLKVELVDASTGSCATFPQLQLSTSSLAFISQIRKTFAFPVYSGAAKNVKVRVTGAAASSCSSDRFAIRPSSLAVTSSANADPTGANAALTPTVIAGAAFTLNAATAVAGYNGIPAVDNTKVIAHTGAVANGTVAGLFGASNPVTGLATGSSFTYSEVGYFSMGTDAVYDSSFTAVDQPNDCTNDFSNMLVGGKYGCKFGNISASSYFGRFIPDHFDVTTDANSPILTQADFAQTSAIVVAPASAGTTTITVNSTSGFNPGDMVRIPGAGAGGDVYTATITAVNSAAATLTLNTAIGTDLVGDGSESLFDEWGSYTGELIKAQLTLTAYNAGGNTTQNYQGAYARLDLVLSGANPNPLKFGAVDTAAPTYNLLLDTSSAATGAFAGGIATISAPLAVTRGASAVGPYNSVQIGIAPTDPDGVKMSGYDLGVFSATPDHTSIMDPIVQNVTAVLYGRLKIANANGSELLPLPIPVTAQYWDGSNYVTNSADSATMLDATTVSSLNWTNLTPGNWQKLSASSTWAAGATSIVPATASVVFVNGTAGFKLAAPPGSGKTGSVDITSNAPTYLPTSTTARATFGVYKGANEFIYLRENY